MRGDGPIIRATLAAFGVMVWSAAWAQATAPAKPYQGLFKAQDVKGAAARALAQAQDVKAAAARALTQAERDEAARLHPKCTIRVIPADPRIDPKIRVDRPPSDVTHTLRIIPPACR